MTFLLRSYWRLFLFLMVSAFGCELGVMYALPLVLRHSSPLVKNLADALVLITLLSPIFYIVFVELQRRERARRQAEGKLQYRTFYDELTGLPNRRLFHDRLTQALALARRHNHLVGLLAIDLDNFKLVNDSLGHSSGDILLGQVATRLRMRVREGDTLARMGGDEFNIVLTRLEKKTDAERVAREFLEVLSTPFEINHQEINVGASLGISLFPADAGDTATLLQHADCAMYAAKLDHYHHIRSYTTKMGSTVRQRMTLQHQLQGAIERGEITVHYQPEFHLGQRRLVRFEALARWNHPSLGNISPGTFIPIAEDSGLIHALGAHVMDTACREAVTWQAFTDFRPQVAINVSSIQFARKSFVDEVVETLARTGLNPSQLQIEVTESAMVAGLDHAAETIRRLQEHGVSFAIDDFGTGYSSLSYLPHLSFDCMKIDRSFVSELGIAPKTRMLVQSLISIAHNFHMQVIAEGVENDEQLALLTQLGCDEVQGFLLGHPVPDPQVRLAQLSTVVDGAAGPSYWNEPAPISRTN